MKLQRLFTGGIIIMSCLQLWAQTNSEGTDKTKLITNADFEGGTTGWDIENLQMQTNTSFTKKQGNVYFEKWVSQGSSVGSASIRQTIENLPVGRYRLTLSAQNLSQGNTSKKNTGAYVFADNERTPIYTPDDYSVEFSSFMGKAEIGFTATGATGNWLSLDNFRLTLIGEVTKDYVISAVNDKIAEAEELLNTIAGDADGGDVVLNGITEYRQTIDNAKAILENNETTIQQMADAITAIDKAMFALRLANATSAGTTAPKVTKTNHYVATGATQALMRATFTGSQIMERGVCWSTNREPTVLDNRSTKLFSLNGTIVHVRGLQPSTVYYLRPYVMTKTYEVAYGDEVKIVTHPKGTCSGSWNEGAPEAAANTRCRIAIKQTIEYFNEWTGIAGFHLSGNYGAGTQTADCSYGGWMRIGPNAGNQAIGTVLHETGHGVGVGTHWRWTDSKDLRENPPRGKWLGREANDVLKFLENNYTPGAVFFTGDHMHGWGSSTSGATITYDWLVNGADKDRHDELQYIGGMCILHGLFIDGLCPTSADVNGISGYTYNFDDSKKYYLMSKDSEYGLGSGLLCQYSASGIGWKYNLMNEQLSDSAAWYMEYDAKNCAYSFRNAATGRYITHATGISANKPAKLTVNQYFQLMPDRTDVTIGTGTAAKQTHGYWMTWVKDGSKAMAASPFNTSMGFGVVLQQAFDFSNSATTQQWIIISEDELDEYRAAVQTTAVREITTSKDVSTDAVYDLQGRRINNPTRGLYIVNGRKVVIR